MAFFLTNDQKKNALFHLTHCQEWLDAMKKECEKEPTSTVYLKEKIRQVRHPLDAIEYMIELTEKEEQQ